LVTATPLRARRRRLKLSRVALARVLEVDPATVYGQERAVVSVLWNYALRAIELRRQRQRSGIRTAPIGAT
jgi:predicted transcriptional regulator